MSREYTPLRPLPEDPLGKEHVFGRIVRKAYKESFPEMVVADVHIQGVISAVMHRFGHLLILTEKQITQITDIVRQNLGPVVYGKKQEEEPLVEALQISPDLKHQRYPMMRRRASVW